MSPTISKKIPSTQQETRIEEVRGLVSEAQRGKFDQAIERLRLMPDRMDRSTDFTLKEGAPATFVGRRLSIRNALEFSGINRDEATNHAKEITDIFATLAGVNVDSPHKTSAALSM